MVCGMNKIIHIASEEQNFQNFEKISVDLESPGNLTKVLHWINLGQDSPTPVLDISAPRRELESPALGL